DIFMTTCLSPGLGLFALCEFVEEDMFFFHLVLAHYYHTSIEHAGAPAEIAFLLSFWNDSRQVFVEHLGNQPRLSRPSVALLGFREGGNKVELRILLLQLGKPLQVEEVLGCSRSEEVPDFSLVYFAGVHHMVENRLERSHSGAACDADHLRTRVLHVEVANRRDNIDRLSLFQVTVHIGRHNSAGNKSD